jgi:hypothetical protein
MHRVHWVVFEVTPFCCGIGARLSVGGGPGLDRVEVRQRGRGAYNQLLLLPTTFCFDFAGRWRTEHTDAHPRKDAQHGMMTSLEKSKQEQYMANKQEHMANTQQYSYRSASQKTPSGFVNTSPASSSSSSSAHQPTKKIHAECSTQRLTPFDQETINQIDRVELQRDWGPHLVPLQFVIQRTIAQVFCEMQTLTQGCDFYFSIVFLMLTNQSKGRKKRETYRCHSTHTRTRLCFCFYWSHQVVRMQRIMIAKNISSISSSTLVVSSSSYSFLSSGLLTQVQSTKSWYFILILLRRKKIPPIETRPSQITTTDCFRFFLSHSPSNSHIVFPG